MPRVPRIIPVSDLRQDVAAVMERLKGSGEPMFITQRGRTAAVILSFESWARSQHERELLMQLAKGEKDVADGKLVNLDSVMQELDELLSTGDAD